MREMALLRYVILSHEGAGPGHYDLMFETSAGSDLATWRSATWPPEPGEPAEKIADHRRTYLSYEGKLSGGRGTVKQVESGTCEILSIGPNVLQIDLRNPQPVRPPLSLRLVERSDGLWDITAGA